MLARGTTGQRIVQYIPVLVIAAMAPFLSLPDNIIGVLIIGFALYQAWRMNKRATLVVKGPFELKTA